ncbi:MAG TPA: ArsI/CadI family heavy metal resistance metalloenzyme [Polyangiaceae bacterium]|jgi:predicted lactoylglutathione lyase|nr:ArsI/CadI family heavy metal resistance metalloenzyme [Polyangiaceae bacterium]
MNVLKAHVSLNVSNIDASVSFYEKLFRVGPSKRRPGYAKFDLAEPSLNLTMQEAPRTGVNASHFGMQVASTEDVAAAWTRFKEVGLKTLTEENTECCYALQDKVWVEDPDGNSWEVFVVKGEATTTDRQTNASGCCVPKVQSDPISKAKNESTPKAGGGCCA